MCGRYYIDDGTAREIERVVKEVDKQLKLKNAREDVYPSQEAPVIVGAPDQNYLKAQKMTWGFLQWNRKGLLINARAETVKEKPTFRESVEKRRIAIPAGGFYEWNKNKEKTAFYQENSRILYMAGFYHIIEGTERFVIITTAANASVETVHERMPLLLAEDELGSWIYEDAFTEEFLRKRPGLLGYRKEYEQQSLWL